MSLFITSAMVTIEMHLRNRRFLSLVIYRLPGIFNAIIGKLYIKLKLEPHLCEYNRRYSIYGLSSSEAIQQRNEV